MRVLVAGAGGVIGRPLIRQLSAAGHEVVALTRSEAKRLLLAQAGAEPVICDALDGTALARCIGSARPEVVVNQLTALPSRLHPRRIGRDLAATIRLRNEGTRNLMAACAGSGVAYIVAQSAAFAYAPGHAGGNGTDGTLRQEGDALYHDAPGGFAGAVAALARLEEATLQAPRIPAAVLRYGFFYGPGTSYAPDGTIAADVRRRRFPVVGKGCGVWSFIHVEDAASATVAAIAQRAEGIYNVVDDEPAPVADWLPAYAAALGAPPPPRVPAWIGQLAGGSYAAYLMIRMPGARNDHAKGSLGWRPARASWRDGFREELTATH